VVVEPGKSFLSSRRSERDDHQSSSQQEGGESYVVSKVGTRLERPTSASYTIRLQGPTVDLVSLFLSIPHDLPLDPITRDEPPTDDGIGIPTEVDQERFPIKQLLGQHEEIVPTHVERGGTSRTFVTPEIEDVAEQRTEDRHGETTERTEEFRRRGFGVELVVRRFLGMERELDVRARLDRGHYFRLVGGGHRARMI
jgi:hypothetical protein